MWGSAQQSCRVLLSREHCIRLYSVKYSEDKDSKIDCLTAVHLKLCLLDVQAFGSKQTFLLAV